MKIRYKRMLMQRFRSVLHFIDPLLRRKHEVCLTLGRTKFIPEKFYADPWSIHAADKAAMKHLIHNFGMKVKGIDKVSWTNDKYGPCDLILSNDARGVVKGKSEKGTINLPYMGFDCYTPKGCFLVGNPLCQNIRDRQSVEKEKKGMVLIVHPGGGRDFLSPKRKKFPPKSVIANNIRLMNKTISSLPKSVSEVVIKTHPAPYLTCDCKTMTDKVLPFLESSFPVSVRDDDLIGLICQSEFIINYGSSTSIWLLGSPKKWVNIIDQAQFNLKAKNRRDRIERAENWWEWPQNIPLSNLCSYMENSADRSLPFMKKYSDIYELDPVSKCMELIEEFGSQK